jgi:hypothetical protein
MEDNAELPSSQPNENVGCSGIAKLPSLPLHRAVGDILFTSSSSQVESDIIVHCGSGEKLVDPTSNGLICFLPLCERANVIMHSTMRIFKGEEDVVTNTAHTIPNGLLITKGRTMQLRLKKGQVAEDALQHFAIKPSEVMSCTRFEACVKQLWQQAPCNKSSQGASEPACWEPDWDHDCQHPADKCTNSVRRALKAYTCSAQTTANSAVVAWFLHHELSVGTIALDKMHHDCYGTILVAALEAWAGDEQDCLTDMFIDEVKRDMAKVVPGYVPRMLSTYLKEDSEVVGEDDAQ